MNKTILMTGMAAAVFGFALVAQPEEAFAYRGDPSVKGPSYTQERHEAMTKAFDSNDFDLWAKLMEGKGRVTQVINRENFQTFAKAHKLALEGKLEEAKALRQELGLGLKNGSGRGNGQGFGRSR